jgi:hypothetical protein
LTVTALVVRAARSCETIISESSETLERLVGHLLPTPTSTRPFDAPWWEVPDGDERYVDASLWEPSPAGPWGSC